MASILRTGKLLRYFAGFTRNIVVNSVRENESGNLLQNSACMCSSQFNQSFASNAAPKADISLEKQLRRLDQDVRRVGRISRRDIEEVLEEIRLQRSATSSQSLLVIRCCGNLVPEELPEVRTALVQEIWKTLNSLNVPMDISHYNALLRVYLENEHKFSPTEFLAEIESKAIDPNRVTYQRLIASYCQHGDIEGATRILEFMREKNLPVNENVFNSLILGHSQANDLESAKGILAVMKQAGLEPTADTYTTLLCCYARHGEIDSILSTIEECDKTEIFLLDKDLLDVVYSLTINGHGENIDKVLSKLKINTGFNQDAVNIILRLVNKGYENEGLQILRHMPRTTRNSGELVDTGTFFIKQLVKANRPIEKILTICKQLEAEGLNPKALLIATEAGLNNGVVNNALPLLKELKNSGLPIRQHYFWPLICSVESNEVINILRHMQDEFSIFPTSETVRDYVIPKLKEKNWERVITLLRDAGVANVTAVTAAAYSALNVNQIKEAATIMETYKAYYAPALFRQPLVQSLDKTKNYDAFVNIIRQIHENLLNRSPTLKADQKSEANEVENELETVDTFDIAGAVLNDIVRYFRRDFIKILEKLLPALVKEGFTITNENATKVSDFIGSEMTPTISELLGKLSSGELELIPLKNSPRKRGLDALTIDELERFAANLDSKNENSNNVKRELISACLRSKKLEKTLEVLSKLEAEKFVIPIGVYAQLIDLYCYHSKLEEALALHQKLKTTEKDFILDNSKTLNIVQALLQAERLDEALKFLAENSKSELPAENEGSYNYASSVWRILNSFADTGDAEKLQKVFDALVQYKYIVPTNVLLGPLIKVHLTRDDLTKAIDVFEQCCENYKSTPWKNELACRLIQKEDAVNLQKLTDLSTTIHGEVNSLYDLVFSFVECGRIRQARKILETPGMRTRPQRINNACERYKNEGMIQPLEGLIEATKDLNHIDRNKIYYNLLLSYTKSGEAEKGLGLWTKMQEENITPTDIFLIKLAELLKSKDMEIPFVLPQKGPVKEQKQDKQQVTSTTTIVGKSVKPPANITLLRKAILAGDVDTAISYKEQLSGDEKLSLNNTTLLIEQLVRAGRIVEATKYVQELLDDKKTPLQRVFKFYLNKLAIAGDIDTIQNISKQINDDIKKLVSFDNRLCNAYIAANKIDEYLKLLNNDLIGAKTPEAIAQAASKFPRGGALGLLTQRPDILPQFEELAEKYAEQKQLGPINVLWMYHISNNNEVASKAIWDKHLSNAPRLMFQRVLQTAREQKDEKLATVVINQLRDSKISEGAIGNSYSCLIDIQTNKNENDKALETLKTAIKDVSLENINRSALIRLKTALENEKKEFPYTLPEKKSKNLSSTSSSQSSDDDVTPPRPETIPTKHDNIVKN